MQYSFFCKDGISSFANSICITRFDGEGGKGRRLLYVSPIDPSPYLTSHTITLFLILDINADTNRDTNTYTNTVTNTDKMFLQLIHPDTNRDTNTGKWPKCGCF